ncbi:glycogen debranching N-terminal domain-containing protein [Kitasatospora sp. NPDC004614]|uniref:amylo-alpha-1,6-glucosidase n=1 Tax=unclassified Kitasatospora TaxID=2633591 RepID=UPI0036CD9C1C
MPPHLAGPPSPRRATPPYGTPTGAPAPTGHATGTPGASPASATPAYGTPLAGAAVQQHGAPLSTPPYGTPTTPTPYAPGATPPYGTLTTPTPYAPGATPPYGTPITPTPYAPGATPPYGTPTPPYGTPTRPGPGATAPGRGVAGARSEQVAGAAAPGAARQPAPAAVPRPQPSAAHDVLCVNAPGMAASGPDGQLRGQSLHGFFRHGVRTLARMELRLGGVEPLPLQGTLTSAAAARFLGSVRVPGDLDPDPALTVERLRHADGAETVTVRNTGARPARLPLEIALGTDLGQLTDIAAGRRSADLPGQVQSSGLRWAGQGRAATVSARPSPHAVLAGAGVLRWDLDIQPGARWSVDLQVELEAPSTGRPPTGRGPGVPLPWSEPEVRADDRRATRLVGRALDTLSGLLLADADRPTDLYTASGAPWRFGLTAADALWAARMTLPLGTRLAAGTLRATARRQHLAPQPSAGAARPAESGAVDGASSPSAVGSSPAVAAAPGGAPAAQPAAVQGVGSVSAPATDSGAAAQAMDGVIPGPLRHGGPELPASCTATEATLLFVTVLAEAWRWGMPRAEVAELLPAAERALGALRAAVAEGPDGPVGFVTDLGRPAEERAARPGPARCEVQAQAHRAALQGADLLEAFDRPGAAEWRAWAAELRERFREQFWIDDLSGGRPAAALLAPDRPVPALASTLVHLFDVGLGAEGELHEGLLDREQTRLLAQRLVTPELDCGWGLRTLSAKSPRFNPLGHRSGVVRVQETALAVSGLVDAGFEREAEILLEGLLEASAHFEYRLPEMYAGEQKVADCPPVPHPAACRPAAMSAAAAVHLVLSLAGVRPDVPSGRVATHPASTAPLGALELTGLRVAGEPFSVRVSRIGVAVVEEAPSFLQLAAG